MKAPALVLAAGLALAGCQTKPPPALTPENVALVCSSALLAYAIWEATASQKTKPATVAKVRAGFASVQSVCADPPRTNAEAVLSAIGAVQAWQAQIEAAKP